MSPAHVRAQPGDVAPIALLVGDPGRAKRIAARLEGAVCYNDNRGLLGYTGTYRGARVSAQTTAMGAPSAAIVAEEIADLGCRTIIRLGTCGASQDYIAPTDLIIATAACALDGTTRQYAGDGYAPAATFEVVEALVAAARVRGVTHHVGLVATQDALYGVDPGWVSRWSRLGVLAQEMETSALFTVAAVRGMRAGSVLVASNAAGHHERLPDAELLPAVERMIEVGLEAVLALSAWNAA